MASIKARGKRAAEVRQKVLDDRCLIDGCDGKPTRRGLCTNHYHRFRVTLAGKTKAQAAEAEERLIESGLVLPVGEVREIRQPNPFEAT